MRFLIATRARAWTRAHTRASWKYVLLNYQLLFNSLSLSLALLLAFSFFLCWVRAGLCPPHRQPLARAVTSYFTSSLKSNHSSTSHRYDGPELDFVRRIDNLLGSVGKIDSMGIRRCCRKGMSCNVCNPPEAHNSSLDIKDSVGYVRLLKTVLDQERNVRAVHQPCLSTV